MAPESDFIFHPPGASDTHPPRRLLSHDTPELEFTFYDRLEIGRFHPERKRQHGFLLIRDPVVSARHCIITQTENGRCFIRDVSRNGTRVDGRRLVPSVEVELEQGQIITVGEHCNLRLGEKAPLASSLAPRFVPTTAIESGITDATMLVGDIRGYTHLVQNADPEALQQSVSRVFQRLEAEVQAQSGTVKEYPGDAIVAFWDVASAADHSAQACRAAIVLNALAEEIAEDRNIWNVPGYPLGMDWALATGPVVIRALGGDHPKGLAVLGEPVILAFRLEKLADDNTGPIIVCPTTRKEAGDAFSFRKLENISAEGFTKVGTVYSLEIDR